MGGAQDWGSGCSSFPGRDVLRAVLELDEEGGVSCSVTGKQPKKTSKASLKLVKWGLGLAVLLTSWEGKIKGVEWATVVPLMLC